MSVSVSCEVSYGFEISEECPDDGCWEDFVHGLLAVPGCYDGDLEVSYRGFGDYDPRYAVVVRRTRIYSYECETKQMFDSLPGHTDEELAELARARKAVAEALGIDEGELPEPGWALRSYFNY